MRLCNEPARKRTAPGARRDRKRRQALIEGSFADAANNHGFKRSRWRRLWRQEIQDWLIAGIQNIRILLNAAKKRTSAAAAVIVVDFGGKKPKGGSLFAILRALSIEYYATTTFDVKSPL